MRLPGIAVVILFALSPSPPSEGESPLPKKHDGKNKVSQTLASDTKSSSKPPAQPKRLLNSTLPSPGVDSPDRVEGIALKLRSWPAEKDKMALVHEMKVQGLEMAEEMSLIRVWMFEWADQVFRDLIPAQVLCIRLEEKLDSLDYCRPLAMPVPEYNGANPL